MTVIALQITEAGKAGMSMTKSKIKNTRPTLSSLPIELLNHIGSLLDRNSLIGLKSVSSTFAPLDDLPLWRGLSLSLPRYYGARPIVQPYERIDELTRRRTDGGRQYRQWVAEEGNRTHKLFLSQLKDKLRGMIKREGRQQWEAVEAVAMSPGEETISLMVRILRRVSGNLLSLAIDAETYSPFPYDPAFETLGGFDFDPSTLGQSLLFPSLTHLRLTSLSSDKGAFVIRLCEIAINITSLDIEFCRNPAEEPDPFLDAQEVDDTVYTLAQDTKLRRLRFSWDEEGERNDYPAASLFIGIFERSPEAEQVVLSFKDTALTDQTSDDLLSVLGGSESLQDLRWPVAYMDPTWTGWAVKRLVVGRYRLDKAFQDFRPMEHLQELVLDGHPTVLAEDYGFTGYPDPYPTQSTFPFFADSLRHDTPQLHMVSWSSRTSDKEDIDLFTRLDAVNGSASVACITSMCHGEEEVIQMIFLREFVEVADRPYEGVENPGQPESGNIVTRYETYVGGCQVIREKEVKRLTEPIKLALTNYGPRHGSWGVEVPAEILQKMREMEGDRVKDWDRRGVEVKAETWAVLSEWYRDHQGKDESDGDESQ